MISGLSSEHESGVATEISSRFSDICQLNNDPPLPVATYMILRDFLPSFVTMSESNFPSIMINVSDPWGYKLVEVTLIVVWLVIFLKSVSSRMLMLDPESAVVMIQVPTIFTSNPDCFCTSNQ